MFTTGSRTVLAKLLRSRLRAKVLGWLLSHPTERFFVRQLQSLVGEDPTNLSRELSRLAGMGVLTCRTEGRQKYYQANRQCPIFAELQGLVIKTTGVAEVLRTALAPLAERIDVAFMYGSAARGDLLPHSDVDVLVVGAVTFAEVASRLGMTQETLGREVNPSVYPREEFRTKLAAGHHFLRTICDGHKVFLIGDERELTGLGEERLAVGAQEQPAGDR